MSEVQNAKLSISKKKRSVLHSTVAGPIARKNRCLNALSSELGLFRKAMRKADTNVHATVKGTRK